MGNTIVQLRVPFCSGLRGQLYVVVCITGAIIRIDIRLTVVVESVEGDLSILTDLDEIAVGVTHVAAPFPAVIV
jgi:hypothetical protein